MLARTRACAGGGLFCLSAVRSSRAVCTPDRWFPSQRGSGPASEARFRIRLGAVVLMPVRRGVRMPRRAVTLAPVCPVVSPSYRDRLFSVFIAERVERTSSEWGVAPRAICQAMPVEGGGCRRAVDQPTTMDRACSWRAADRRSGGGGESRACSTDGCCGARLATGRRPGRRDGRYGGPRRGRVCCQRRRGRRPRFSAPAFTETEGEALIAADFDSNATPDIALIDARCTGLVVLRGRGDGNLRHPVASCGDSDDGIEGTAAADVNNDGRPDVMAL
jgi:FG-GAP-like repeat